MRTSYKIGGSLAIVGTIAAIAVLNLANLNEYASSLSLYQDPENLNAFN
jgi:hypothetical protein